MLARNEVIIKWTLYGAATLLCFFVQGFLCQRITLLGIIPFLYPMLAAIPATYEAPVPSTIFALCVGVVCDILLPGPYACFHTLVFPIVGLCASLLAAGVLRAGFLCSLAVTILAFFLTDITHCLQLFVQGTPSWDAGMSLMLRELAATLPFSFPVTVLYRAVARRVHLYD